MATEPLEYKVTFDTSEVAQKLAEVKNSMDVAFGAQAFAAAGPDAYPFQAMFDSPALSMAKEGATMAQDTFGSIQSVFNTMAETSRLGYSKFTRDLEMTGLMAGSMRGAPQALTYGQHMQQIREGSWWDDITGGMGVGYSPTMPMSRKEYTQAYRKETMADFMEPSWGEAGAAGFGLAAAAAFGAGPIGWTAAAIPAAALAGKAALYPFTSELRHQRALESFVGGTSWRFLSGQFGREDRENLGQYLRELPDQPGIAARDYSRGEVDEMLSTFTEAGGYDYVRTAQDYKEKTKQLFKGHRELMHTLHVSSKEAVALMGQLSRDLGIDNFAAFSGEVGALAAGAGLTSSEAASFIMKSSEMVRGTGYNMTDFALSAGRMLQDVKGMARAGIISDEDLRQYGGEQGIALNMARSAMNYAGSPAGFVTAAALESAQLGGGGLADVAGMGFQQRLGATAGLLSNPWSIMTFDPQKGAEQMGPQLSMMDKTATYLDKLRSLVGGRKMTGREFEVAIQKLGATKEDARQMRYQFETAGSDLPTMAEQNRATAAEVLRQRTEEGETPAGRAVRQAAAAVEGKLWTPLTKRAERMHTAIEQVAEVGGGVFERAWYDITGGVFTTETTKQAGLELAYQLGDDYAERHETLMSMNEDQLEKLNMQIAKTRGKSQLKITKHKFVQLTEEEMRQRGIGAADRKLVEYEVAVANLSANEARVEVERTLENIGREEAISMAKAMPAIGGMMGPVASLIGIGTKFLTPLLTSLGFESAESRAMGEIAKGLGGDMSQKRVQADLARLVYATEAEWEGIKDPEETQEEFTKRRVLEYAKPWLGKLGEKERKQFKEFIAGWTPEARAAFGAQGEALWKQSDRERYETERRRVAEERILDRGEKVTDASMSREMKNISWSTVMSNLIDVPEEQREGREAAYETYRERFKRQYKTTPEEMMYKESDAGGVVFDEGTARQIEMKNNIETVQLLTRFVNGQGKSIPVHDAPK